MLCELPTGEDAGFLHTYVKYVGLPQIMFRTSVSHTLKPLLRVMSQTLAKHTHFAFGFPVL